MFYIGEINSQIKDLVEILDEEASQYDNSQLKNEQCTDWSWYKLSCS